MLSALLVPAGGSASGPGARGAAVCADYPNQAAAQRAKDTRDADGDGIYCESLPCPCLAPDPRAQRSPQRSHTRRRRAQRIAARVTEVVDGDTIKVRAEQGRHRRYTVRLIGIDTPESKRPGTPVECGALKAASYMTRLALSRSGRGRAVTLRTDPTQDTFDRYGRLLAYVTPHGRRHRMLQLRMLASGWAKVYVYEHRPFQQYRRFRAVERRASQARRGVWKRCHGDFHSAS